MPFATVADRYGTEDVKRFYADGLWRPETMSELLDEQVGRRGDKVFVTDGTASLTYRELRRAAGALAAGFVAVGIGPGDRVSVQIPSWTEFMPIAVALNRLGAIMVPIMPIYRADDVGFILRTAGVRLAVTCGFHRGFDYPAMYAGLRAGCPDLAEILLVRPTADVPQGMRSYDALLAAGAADLDRVQGPGTGPDEPLVIVFSSGTTARPKGCLHTFNTFGCGSRQLGRAFGYSETDVQFSPSPITHTTGLVTGFLLPLMHGASVHLMDAWDPRAALEAIAEHRTTAAVTATTFLQTLMDVFDPERHDPSSMRLWVSAGAPIPAAFVRQARRLLPNLRVLSLYGRTENVTTTTCTVDDDPERSVTSDGRVLPGGEVRVVDEHGAEVPRGVEGDIAYRGPMHMLEYIGNPEETAKLFTPEGFSRSGDLGVMDADGYVRVTGRLKDIVIRGGLNISVRQIEELLVEHPAVAAVAAVGMPDQRLGEKVCCFIVPADGQLPPTLEELSRYLLDRGLAIQKVPERVEVVSALPMTATGKVQKHLLRAEIAGLLEQQPAVG